MLVARVFAAALSRLLLCLLYSITQVVSPHPTDGRFFLRKMR